MITDEVHRTVPGLPALIGSDCTTFGWRSFQNQPRSHVRNDTIFTGRADVSACPAAFSADTMLENSGSRRINKPSFPKPRAGSLQMCEGKIPSTRAAVQSETRIDVDNRNVQFSLLWLARSRRSLP